MGQPESRICNTCGESNPASERFCVQCKGILTTKLIIPNLGPEPPVLPPWWFLVWQKFLKALSHVARLIPFPHLVPRPPCYPGKKLVLVMLSVLLIIGLVIGSIIWFILPPNPFDPIQITNNESIGISMGRTVFDTDRVDSSFKADAAQASQNKNYNSAYAYWDLAIREDETDAEVVIYKEDQLVQDSGRPYITLVVLVSLSGDHAAVSTGREILQGAYVAQAEYNGGLSVHSVLPGRSDPKHKLPNNYLLRLIIANVGTPSSTDTQVAERIIQEKNNDPTIVGVIGQLANEDATIQKLEVAKIPMISSTQLAGNIVGTPYLLSAAPSPEQEGKAAADYACNITHDHVAIFYDQSDSSSNQMEQAFDNEFTRCGGSINNPNQYTLGDEQTLGQLFDQVWSADNNLRLIYLPGASPDDAISIQKKGSQAQILGSNAFYQFVHATEPAKSFAGISYTAFAFHGEWAGNVLQESWLLQDYPAIFDAQKQHQHTFYSVQIPDADAILAYDATDVLVGASGEVLGNGQPKGTHLFDALWEKLQAPSFSFQGFSGCISFDSDGQPRNKDVVVLQVRADGTNYVAYPPGPYQC